jgi:ABC-type glycerol-3-phosphate transport system permease component
VKIKKCIVKIIDYFVLGVLSSVIIVPLIWILGNALKSDKDVRVNMSNLLPSSGEWQFSNFSNAWQRGNIGQSVLNSVIITIISVFFILIVSYLTAFAIARIEFKGSEIIFALFVSMMMVPLAQVVMIPQFKLISSMKMVNTYQGVILLYVAGGIPFSVFLLSSFLRTIPLEIDKAAAIDGCNKIQIITKILLPLSKPGLATVIIFQSMTIWNDYFTPLIYLQSSEMRTITLSLKNFMGQWGLVDYNRLFAAIAMVTFPIVIVYIIFQKQFISGLTSGSVKG